MTVSDVCAILQTIILLIGVYTTWAIAYNKVLPFHRLKWEHDFIEKRKKNGM